MNKNYLPLRDQQNLVFFNTCFDKGYVKELVSWFLIKYGEKATINFLESLKFIGFHEATTAGISLGIEDLEIPPEKPFLITEAHISTHKIEQKSAAGSLTSVEKSQCLIDTWNQTSDLLRHNAIQNFKNRNIVNPVYMMAFSGARGNVSQVRQLVAMRGLMADPQGAILEFPIQSNFREGLTITEYLISCYGARKGLVDTALRTATSGYLTRRLVDSAQHAVISMIDCGTKKNTLLEGKNLSSRLIGRVLGKSLISNKHKPFLRNHIILPTDAKLISQNYTQVFVRSPLTCESATSICQLCYGWNLASSKLVQIGEAVGVIAAQSIGEPGTQLTMRTFHTGGVGVFSDQALKPIFSNYDGKIIFEDSIPGHFIRTPHGKIVYMIKYIPTNPEKVFLRIQPLNLNVRELVIKEQDLPPGSLLFVKQGEFINAKKLIAQASHVKLTKQRLPESSHPVYSSLEGQIFFESMNLLIEKEIATDIDVPKRQFENLFSTNELSILPDIRKMAKIGSFWVFSAYNQHEIHTLDHFIEAGDLVSEKTILFNYKFHSPIRAQLQTINSRLTFGRHNIQIPISKINFLKNNYKFYSTQINSNSQRGLIKNASSLDPVKREIALIENKFIYHKKHKQSGLIFWYPISNSKFTYFTFKHFISLYTEYFSKIKSQKFLKIPKGTVFSVSRLNSTFERTTSFKSTLVQKFSKTFIINPKNKSKYQSHFQSHFNQSTQENLNFNKNFVETAIQKSKQQIKSSSTNTLLLELHKFGWPYILDKKIPSTNSFVKHRQFLSAGLAINKVCFPKQNISIKDLNIINLKELKLNQIVNSGLSGNVKKLKFNKWYDSKNLINKITTFNTKDSFKIQDPVLNQIDEINSVNRYTINCNYPLRNGLIWYKQPKNNLQLRKTLSRYFSSANLFLVQPVTECSFLRKEIVERGWSGFATKIKTQNPKNFFFTKQKPTPTNLAIKQHSKLLVHTKKQSGWYSFSNVFKIQLLNSSSFFNSIFSYQTLENTLNRGLSIYEYNYANFPEFKKFSFKTYLNSWILPVHSFSSGTVKLKRNGEFRYKTKKTTGTFISIIRNTDILTVQTKNPNFLPIGTIVRWGQEFQPGYASDHNGQILKKTKKHLTLRVGVPILASAHGIIHVVQDDLVFKNQLLITLKSRRLQTEDIVQGIPKIEQLFEARESQGGEILFDTVHIRLRNSFLRELESLENEHWSKAVEKSFLEAQQFLVENILDAYANQGVKISEKHVEVIVRQMTSRVRILESGETGLLPGELVQHNWIQKFNKQISAIGLREATYEPIVLGISKSVLQSESFLLAASFQEVSRVLVRSALSKKRDFLRGLHENVIVGQLIPAGTGLVGQFNNTELQTSTTSSF